MLYYKATFTPASEVALGASVADSVKKDFAWSNDRRHVVNPTDPIMVSEVSQAPLVTVIAVIFSFLFLK